MSGSGKCGYKGKWAYIDLSGGKVLIADSDPRAEEEYIGGRGLQAHLLARHLRSLGGPLRDPLGPDNRIILGTSAPNDTKVHTAGRGSASFISPMTRSESPLSDDLPHVYGLITHASVGGSWPNKLKKAGFDQLIIDGRSETPVRIEIADGDIRIVDAEPDLFEERDGARFPLRSGELNKALQQKVNGDGFSSLYLGPAGWIQIPFACLTNDGDRNFGRGGGGAVFGSKNLVAVSVTGSGTTTLHNEELFNKRFKEMDEAINTAVGDPEQTASFRPESGTTWWLDRAFHGGYLGKEGGYLPWHNYDEGHFDEKKYSSVSTGALLEISDKRKLCSRCRAVICSRLVKMKNGEMFPRPEFETIALFINCCITDREAIVELNHLCNEVGLDTMSTASIIAGGMDMDEKGILKELSVEPLPFGDSGAMGSAIEAIAYGRKGIGALLGDTADRIAWKILDELGDEKKDDLLWCLTTTYAGLGYAGVAAKAFPAMHTCYATSNRGRGDHTYGWTVQAEEAGMAQNAETIAPLVAGGQWGKALVDSLGVCDFIPFDVTSEVFLDLLFAINGNRYTTDEIMECGRRILNLERSINNLQGRSRSYDEHVPPKLTVPMTSGAMKGRKVDPDLLGEILDAYYKEQGWNRDGLVTEETLKTLGISPLFDQGK